MGEARAGKSNLIAAIRAVLDPESAPISPSDLGPEVTQVHIEAQLEDGTHLELRSMRDGAPAARQSGAPPVVFVPALLRSGPLVAPSGPWDPIAGTAAHLLTAAIGELEGRRAALAPDITSTASAQALVNGMESFRTSGVSGLIVLIEEPELYLPPHAQRYLYRLLVSLAAAGNQVVYSTHAPTFLNVSRLEDLVLVERRAQGGTRVVQPEPLPTDEDFRAMSEFDSSRSELFLSRVAVLVEGRTEQLALPFVFQALGHDVDREGISIVACEGKANVALVAQVCRLAGVPFIAVHDRDAASGRQPSFEERVLNDLIGRMAGEDRRVELIPDFEGIAGLRSHRHKPEHAWSRFRSLAVSEIPEPLVRIVHLARKATIP